jgi:hypothetical protein
MRYQMIALALTVMFAAPQVARAQHDHNAVPGSSHDHHMMMMEHHSAATIDTLVAHRDTLGLTLRQLDQLAELRREFASADKHPMGQMNHEKMNHDTMDHVTMDHATMMEEQSDRLTLDRVPGRMVPRIDRAEPASHCANCPCRVLTDAQREHAHDILGHNHQR